jgi:hypothetical protein
VKIRRILSLFLLTGLSLTSLLLIHLTQSAASQRQAALPPPEPAPTLAAAPSPSWTPAIPILGRAPRPAPSPPNPALPQPERLQAALSGPAPAADLRNTNLPAGPTSLTGWFENDTQGVRQTWTTLNITGAGVRIAVLDSGVDFGNPALAGRHAVQPATAGGVQAYVGWPIAFDATSMEEYIDDPGRAWPGNWVHYVNAGHPVTGTGVFAFSDPLDPANVYTVPGTSQSGRYYVGYHPDVLLDELVLVADTALSGTYDAAYLDLDSDGTFETRQDRSDPVGALDLTGDGVPDSSAGLLYWIADGSHTPPGMDGVYGAGGPVPAAGTLLAYMIDDTTEPGGWHGTACASAAVGDDNGLFLADAQVASFYTATYGSLVQGPAPGARIVAMGNVYAGGSLRAWYTFTLLGYDGLPGTGDEPHLVTLSFGDGSIDNEGWDEESRLLTHLSLFYGAASPLFLHSAGNGGPGYGTNIAPYPATALIVGASTQYGTAKVWGISETVSYPQRVNWGDVTSFSGRGPGADGRGAVDLVANGMAGTGAYPLNAERVADGTLAYVHWYGTSRSVPAAAGMAALAYQGFYQAHGRYPTYDEGIRLMLNAAADLGYDPLVQGAGAANAFRATQSALGQYGITVEPPRLALGDFRGRSYPAFSGGLARGEVATVALTLTNPARVPVTLTMRTAQLVEVGRYVTWLETITDITTNHPNGPDYALDLTPWIVQHPEADLLVVRLALPFEHFDTLPPTPSDNSHNRWRLMAYNWWDDDGDGVWWDDDNGDGRVEWPAEIDAGDEWVRFDYSTVNANVHELRIGHPYSRSVGAGSAGIWLGTTHNTRSPGDNRTELAFEILFFRQDAWQDIALSQESLLLPAGGQAALQALVRIPSDAAYGLHQGMVIVSDAGRTDLDPLFAPRQVNVPLIWQVWPDLAAGASIGGEPHAGTLYQNGWMAAGFDWNRDNLEAGDWRFYHFDVQDPPAGAAILAHTRWQDYPTDLDTLILGPDPDDFSSDYPEWFGPAALGWIGGSQRAGSRPRWEFQTSTGGTEEWAAAPAQDGLHALAQQAVLLGGHQLGVPFTTSIGLVQVAPYPLSVDPAECPSSCTLTATLRASVDIPIGLTVTHAFGWSVPVTIAGSIAQGEIVTHGLVFTEAIYRLEVALEDVTHTTDLDLGLYDDSGSLPDIWDVGDRELARAEGSGVEKTTLAYALPAGGYWLRVVGEVVEPGGAQYLVQAVAVASNADGAFSVGGLPAAIAAHQTVTFTISIAPAPAPGRQGLLVLGLPVLPRVLEVPLLIQSPARCYLPLVAVNLP